MGLSRRDWGDHRGPEARGVFPLALMLTLALGLVDPPTARALAHEPARAGAIWGFALARAVEAIADAGQFIEMPARRAQRSAIVARAREVVSGEVRARVRWTGMVRGEGGLAPPTHA